MMLGFGWNKWIATALVFGMYLETGKSIENEAMCSHKWQLLASLVPYYELVPQRHYILATFGEVGNCNIREYPCCRRNG